MFKRTTLYDKDRDKEAKINYWAKLMLAYRNGTEHRLRHFGTNKTFLSYIVDVARKHGIKRKPSLRHRRQTIVGPPANGQYIDRLKTDLFD